MTTAKLATEPDYEITKINSNPGLYYEIYTTKENEIHDFRPAPG